MGACLPIAIREIGVGFRSLQTSLSDDPGIFQGDFSLLRAFVSAKGSPGMRFRGHARHSCRPVKADNPRPALRALVSGSLPTSMLIIGSHVCSLSVYSVTLFVCEVIEYTEVDRPRICGLRDNLT